MFCTYCIIIPTSLSISINFLCSYATMYSILFHRNISIYRHLVGSLKMNTTLEYSTRVVQEGDRRCKKSTLNDLAYMTPLRIPLMNPVIMFRTFLNCVRGFVIYYPL